MEKMGMGGMLINTPEGMTSLDYLLEFAGERVGNLVDKQQDRIFQLFRIFGKIRNSDTARLIRELYAIFCNKINPLSFNLIKNFVLIENISQLNNHTVTNIFQLGGTELLELVRKIKETEDGKLILPDGLLEMLTQLDINKIFEKLRDRIGNNRVNAISNWITYCEDHNMTLDLRFLVEITDGEIQEILPRGRIETINLSGVNILGDKGKTDLEIIRKHSNVIQDQGLDNELFMKMEEHDVSIDSSELISYIIANKYKEELDLSFLEEISIENAHILALSNFKRLNLSGISKISSEVLEILLNFSGQIYLGGVKKSQLKDLTILANYRGELIYISNTLLVSCGIFNINGQLIDLSNIKSFIELDRLRSGGLEKGELLDIGVSIGSDLTSILPLDLLRSYGTFRRNSLYIRNAGNINQSKLKYFRGLEIDGIILRGLTNIDIYTLRQNIDYWNSFVIIVDDDTKLTEQQIEELTTIKKVKIFDVRETILVNSIRKLVSESNTNSATELLFTENLELNERIISELENFNGDTINFIGAISVNQQCMDLINKLKLQKICVNISNNLLIEQFVKYNGKLRVYGVEHLNDYLLNILSNYEGPELDLDSINSLTDQQFEALTKFKTPRISIRGLTNLTEFQIGLIIKYKDKFQLIDNLSNEISRQKRKRNIKRVMSTLVSFGVIGMLYYGVSNYISNIHLDRQNLTLDELTEGQIETLLEKGLEYKLSSINSDFIRVANELKIRALNLNGISKIDRSTARLLSNYLVLDGEILLKYLSELDLDSASYLKDSRINKFTIGLPTMNDDLSKILGEFNCEILEIIIEGELTKEQAINLSKFRGSKLILKIAKSSNVIDELNEYKGELGLQFSSMSTRQEVKLASGGNYEQTYVSNGNN